MTTPTSFADIILDWESTLQAVKENFERLPDIERYAQILQDHLDLAKVLKARQDSLTASRQRTTQELQEQLVEGRASVIRLRGAIKAALGHTNERLVQFGMTPRRVRIRRPKVTEISTIEDATPAAPPSAGSDTEP